MNPVGIIGGSGLYDMDLDNRRTFEVDTPFGPPSDDLVSGELNGREVIFLARHGKGHRLLPSELNNRANIFALKTQGVERILSVSAVGSFRKELKPGDIVLVDQFVDRTNQARPNTFFGDGIVAHIQFAHPTCADLRSDLETAAETVDVRVVNGGTYLNMEGPAFSTLSESLLYRSWGMDVIGMTQMSEARLAREAGICYATLAMVTDYDCWSEQELGETVSADAILELFKENVAHARELIQRVIPLLPDSRSCECGRSLENAIVTPQETWPAEAVDRLHPILAPYIKS